MGEIGADVRPGDLSQTLKVLTRVIHERATANPQESYTAALLKGDIDQLLKKIGEEATEFVMAVKDEEHDHICYEAADLLYHLLVVLERTGIGSEELAVELNARLPKEYSAPQG